MLIKYLYFFFFNIISGSIFERRGISFIKYEKICKIITRPKNILFTDGKNANLIG